MLDRLQTLSGGDRNPHIYRQTIAEFRQTRLTGRIATLQRQLLEPTKSVAVYHKDSPKTLRKLSTEDGCVMKNLEVVTSGEFQGGWSIHDYDSRGA